MYKNAICPPPPKKKNAAKTSIIHGFSKKKVQITCYHSIQQSTIVQEESLCEKFKLIFDKTVFDRMCTTCLILKSMCEFKADMTVKDMCWSDLKCKT